MKLPKVFILFIIFPVLTKGQDTIEDLISEVITRLVDDGIVCALYSFSSIDNLISKTLSTTKFSLVSLSLNHWIQTETNATCSAYVVPLENVNFLKTLRPFRRVVVSFVPWKKVVFLYCSSTQYLDFFKTAIDYYPLEVFLIELMSYCGNCTSLNPCIGKDVTVKYFNQNRTLLETNNAGKALSENWTDLLPKKWQPNFRKDRFFRIGVQHCPPYIYLENATVADGIEARIIEEVTKNWPVKYILEGPEIINDWWDETAKLVERYERDIGVCSHWQNNIIEKNVDISYPHTKIYATFIVKKPEPKSEIMLVISMFQEQVYLATSLTMATLAILLTLVKRVYNVLTSTKDSTSTVELVMDLYRLFTGGCIKMTRFYRFSSARFLVLSWTIFCLLYATFGSAGITSVLTKPHFDQVIDTIEDMANQDIHWTLYSDMFQKQFASLDSPVYKKMAKLFRRGKTMKETRTIAMFAKTIQKLVVYDMDSYLPREEWRYYRLLKESFASYSGCFIFAKRSPFTKPFSRATQRFFESGIIDHLTKKFFLEERQYQEGFKSYYEVDQGHLIIDLRKLLGGFLILISGLSLSLLVFIYELYRENKKN
ncbi:unnamed protein product [Phaedon cochleariae]|uniref:Ionotropic receptor n=1 Tax=Phaedon cochleariae TaxID=80249 RepID=A0A9N9X0Y8_PHACE|nr:unnamed protein product [Phaedon cochleariae]